ncbi:hypothetical protein BD626DRAFT_564421 [Schizophyllum amplum]|uniref:Uncharacterized protein n=1 Tax=Schizophyllum amplum TaxID=97359 RepID=A0A550CRS5_9AGAR|nr:hypothetical protein BD626DRAFT_564421 [Auriculariopsis ampla]
MGLNGTDLDPIDPDAWWRNDDGPVFQSSDATVGVGHASFYPTAGWGSRTARAECFTFAQDDSPIFPVPVSAGVELKAAA